jgi:hypothetical protein
VRLSRPSEGVVSTNEVLSLEELSHRLNVGDAWLRSARRAGLRVCYFGRRGFVLGDEFAEFLRRVESVRLAMREPKP